MWGTKLTPVAEKVRPAQSDEPGGCGREGYEGRLVSFTVLLERGNASVNPAADPSRCKVYRCNSWVVVALGEEHPSPSGKKKYHGEFRNGNGLYEMLSSRQETCRSSKVPDELQYTGLRLQCAIAILEQK